MQKARARPPKATTKPPQGHTKARFRCFRLCSGLDLVNFAAPHGVRKVRGIEQSFQPVLKEDRFRYDLQMDKRASQGDTVGIFEKSECSVGITALKSRRGDQHARIEEGSDHVRSRSSRLDGSLSRAPLPCE